MKKAQRRTKKWYMNPYDVNSNVWFYKMNGSFEFHVSDGLGKHVRFVVQDRTLLSYITGKREDKKRR